MDDYFKKQYLNLNYTLPINDDTVAELRLQRLQEARAKVRNCRAISTTTLWSLAAAYSIGAHKFTLAHQRSTGDTGYYTA